MTSEMKALLFHTRCRCTLIMHSPDSLSSLIVDLNHVLTLLNVLNERSIVHVVAGVANTIQSAVWTAGKIPDWGCKYPFAHFQGGHLPPLPMPGGARDQEGVRHFEPRFEGEGVVPGEYFLVSTKLDTSCYRQQCKFL